MQRWQPPNRRGTTPFAQKEQQRRDEARAEETRAALFEGRVASLQRDWTFHVWDESTSTVRWMTAFDTEESDVDEFLAAIAAVTAAVSV